MSLTRRAVAGQAASPADRLTELDGLRGFALLLILLANTLYFSGHYAEHPIPEGLVDQVAVWVLTVTLEQKGLGIFALLFGAGVALQLERLEARRPAGARRILLRRFGLLLVFGLVHTVLLWTGDILRLLAVSGIVLLLFARLSSFALKSGAVIGLLGPLLALCLVAVLQPESIEEPDQTEVTEVGASENGDQTPEALMLTGQYSELVAKRSGQLVPPATRLLNPGGIYYILGMSLLGMLAMRRGWHRPDPGGQTTLWRWRRPLWVVGLLGSLSYAWSRRLDGWAGSSEVEAFALLAGGAVGGVSLAGFYIAAWLHLWHTKKYASFLNLFAPMGRMALTHYLLQSAVMMTLVAGYGLGLRGRVGVGAVVLLALVLYVVQLAVSPLWLSRFRFGPLEWVWRSLTYGSIQPMRLGKVLDGGRGEP